jgi:hypothetical protein
MMHYKYLILSNMSRLAVFGCLCFIGVAPVIAGGQGANPEQAISSQLTESKSQRTRDVGPPPAVYYAKIEGWDYRTERRRMFVRGSIFATSLADTAILRPLGFDIFGFSGDSDPLRDFSTPGIQLIGRWPIDLKWESLPPQLLRLKYDQDYSPEAKARVDSQTAEEERIARRVSVGPPPADWPRFKHDGRDYVEGDIYVSARADTALLSPYGISVIFLTDSGAQGVGRWPVDLPWDSLPPQILRLQYRRVYFKPKLDQSKTGFLDDEGADSQYPVAWQNEHRVIYGVIDVSFDVTHQRFVIQINPEKRGSN